MVIDIPHLLKHFGLRDTQPRRLVLETLMNTREPLSHKGIAERIQKSGGATNLVTVYRVLEKYEELGIIHKHLSSGGYILCSQPKDKGHHILLSCNDCGKVEECCDEDLCKKENAVAKKNGFLPKTHLSEMIGVCSSCT